MAKTIQVSGGNLYRIAQEHLGDAMAAWRIAEASGLTDFWLQGVTTLIIPDEDASLTNGGVPPQQ